MGGTVYANQYVTLRVHQALFDGNSVVYCGGAIYADRHGSVMVEDSEFRNNDAIAVYHSTRILIRNSTLVKNMASNGFGGAMVAVSSTYLVMTDSVLEDNACKDHGGAISMRDKSQGFLRYVIFSGNVAEIDGGAIEVIHSDLQTDYCLFENNSAVRGSGGAIFVLNMCSITISASNFTGNSAILKSGGAIYAKNRIFLTMHDTAMLENRAHSYGGALFVDHKSTVKLSHCCLYDNIIEYYGGAAYVSSSIFIANNSMFLSNKANKGGFMRIWQQSEVYLEKCSVRENKATSQGGVVYVPGSRVLIAYTEFSRNTAIRGRDMYILTDGVYNASSAPSVKLYTYRCVFTLNGTLTLVTTDEYFMEEAQKGSLIYGNDVNVYNEETPYASGRYKASQRSVLFIFLN